MKKVSKTHFCFIDVTPFPDAIGGTHMTSETLDPISVAALNFREAKQI